MNAPNDTQVTFRPARGIDDFRLVRGMLLKNRPLEMKGLNWEVRRWDGAYWHSEEPGWASWKENGVGLWLSGDELVGAAHSDGPGLACLQVHPEFRQIEPAMLAWCEEHLSLESQNGRALTLHALDADATRIKLLTDRGYTPLESGELIRALNLEEFSSAPPSVPEGYSIRATTDDDCAALAALLNAAFGRDFHTERELRTFREGSPSFESQLELVAIAPDGLIAALAGFTREKEHRLAQLEPLCTHPGHRRLGLAEALVSEGLSRLAALRVDEVRVGTGLVSPANRFYEAAGFTECIPGRHWRRIL